jgi:hypothetical protein
VSPNASLSLNHGAFLSGLLPAALAGPSAASDGLSDSAGLIGKGAESAPPAVIAASALAPIIFVVGLLFRSCSMMHRRQALVEAAKVSIERGFLHSALAQEEREEEKQRQAKLRLAARNRGAAPAKKKKKKGSEFGRFATAAAALLSSNERMTGRAGHVLVNARAFDASVSCVASLLVLALFIPLAGGARRLLSPEPLFTYVAPAASTFTPSMLFAESVGQNAVASTLATHVYMEYNTFPPAFWDDVDPHYVAESFLCPFTMGAVALVDASGPNIVHEAAKPATETSMLPSNEGISMASAEMPEFDVSALGARELRANVHIRPRPHSPMKDVKVPAPTIHIDGIVYGCAIAIPALILYLLAGCIARGLPRWRAPTTLVKPFVDPYLTSIPTGARAAIDAIKWLTAKEALREQYGFGSAPAGTAGNAAGAAPAAVSGQGSSGGGPILPIPPSSGGGGFGAGVGVGARQARLHAQSPARLSIVRRQAAAATAAATTQAGPSANSMLHDSAASPTHAPASQHGYQAQNNTSKIEAPFPSVDSPFLQFARVRQRAEAKAVVVSTVATSRWAKTVICATPGALFCCCARQTAASTPILPSVSGSDVQRPADKTSRFSCFPRSPHPMAPATSHWIALPLLVVLLLVYSKTTTIGRAGDAHNRYQWATYNLAKLQGNGTSCDPDAGCAAADRFQFELDVCDVACVALTLLAGIIHGIVRKRAQLRLSRLIKVLARLKSGRERALISSFAENFMCTNKLIDLLLVAAGDADDDTGASRVDLDGHLIPSPKKILTSEVLADIELLQLVYWDRWAWRDGGGLAGKEAYLLGGLSPEAISCLEEMAEERDKIQK